MIKGLTILLLMLALTGRSQNKRSFSDLDSLLTDEKRYVIVFIYTDWCKYCHKMKSQTLSDNAITTLLDSNYYFLELNAETEDDIQFNNKTYHFSPTGINSGNHELAKKLGTKKEKLVFPTLVILDEAYKTILKKPSYTTIPEMKLILQNLGD